MQKEKKEPLQSSIGEDMNPAGDFIEGRDRIGASDKVFDAGFFVYFNIMKLGLHGLIC